MERDGTNQTKERSMRPFSGSADVVSLPERVMMIGRASGSRRLKRLSHRDRRFGKNGNRVIEAAHRFGHADDPARVARAGAEVIERSSLVEFEEPSAGK